ncbi:hypothetical protein ACFWOT_25375 [Streptomyces sp. NPDC058440]|uniref:hypothetical protein n=1 Tax=Streptomyces sp. NPDC058440 TaxID=3346501 RepID=UPI00364CE05C
MTTPTPARTSRPLRSSYFRDDESVFDATPGRIPGRLGPEFGRTDEWPFDCVQRPANKQLAQWKCRFPADPVWNLTARELVFAMSNPTHQALRGAGLFLKIGRWAPATVVADCRRLGVLARWAGQTGLPGDLTVWDSQDWQAFIDDRASKNKQNTVINYVGTVRRLVALAPVLTAAGDLADPWPGLLPRQIAEASGGAGLSTQPIPPGTWWPLLRAAWAWVDRIGPQILDRRELDADRVATPPALPAGYRTGAVVDTMLDAWLADPASVIPVSSRPRSGRPAGTPAWSVISLAVTGDNTSIFCLSGSGKGRASVRRAKVQSLVDQGRTALVDPNGGAGELLGVDLDRNRAERRGSRAAFQQAIDDEVDRWLKEPGNLIPVHPRRGQPSPEIEPVWKSLSTMIFGRRQFAAFETNHPAVAARKDRVRQVVQDPARRMPFDNRGLTELRMIRAACYVFITALSAMRDSEVQEIRRGALTQHYGAPAIASTLVKGRVNKPREHWWIIEPVAQAIALAERLSQHETHIFASLASPARANGLDGSKGFTPHMDIDLFIQHINDTAAQTGLEPIPDTLVRPHMFRKTMSVITRQEPDGEIANGLQLKHAARRALANTVTAAYGQADKQWAKEFNTELETAAAERLVAMLRSRRSGETVAIGPGAHRLHASLDKVNTRLEQAGPDLRANVADQRLEVTLLRDEFADLHLGTINHCLWNRATAECQNALPEGKRGNQPLLGACQPSRCRNSVLTIKHVPIWRLEEQDLTQRLKTRLPAPRRQLIEHRLADVRAVTTHFDQLDQLKKESA